MGSGHFPLAHSIEMGKELQKMAQRLAEIASRYADLCASQDQPDNAFADGGYLERLYIAKEMIEMCVDKGVP